MSQCELEEIAIEGDGLVAPLAGRSLYYGWVMLPLSMGTLIASSPGQTFGISIFNEPMRHSLGLSHGQLAATYMLGTLLGAVPIAFIGRQMDRYGLRRVLLTSICLFSFACLATSLVQSWAVLVMAFCLLRMLGPGALSLSSGNTLAFWFDRRLGMVEGLRQMGMALAMISIPALNLWLVSHWGWRGAYTILGIAVWLVMFPAVALWFRNHPGEVGQSLDGVQSFAPEPSSTKPSEDAQWGFTLGETMRTSTFWIVLSGTALFGLIHTAVFFCLVPILQERGLSPSTAAGTLSVFAVSLAVMQLVGGALADRIAARYLLFTGLMGLGTAILLLLRTDRLAMALITGAVMGASQGIFFGAKQPLWARYFGRRHLGKIRGTLMTIQVAASSLGPLFVGVARDWQGDFTFALLVFAVVPVPVAILSLLVAPPRQLDTPQPLSPAS